MATLKSTDINGDLKVNGTIYGNIYGNVEGTSTYATYIGDSSKHYSYSNIETNFAKSKCTSWLTSGTLGVARGGTGINSLSNTSGKYLMSNGSSYCWGVPSTTANSMADTVTACGPWKMSYGSAEYNSPTYLTSWDPGSKTLRKTKRDAVCVGCAGTLVAKKCGTVTWPSDNDYFCPSGITSMSPLFEYEYLDNVWTIGARSRLCCLEVWTSFLPKKSVYLKSPSLSFAICAMIHYCTTLCYCTTNTGGYKKEYGTCVDASGMVYISGPIKAGFYKQGDSISIGGTANITGPWTSTEITSYNNNAHICSYWADCYSSERSTNCPVVISNLSLLDVDF